MIKKYDLPKTPFQRILESEHVSKKIKSHLKNQFEKLNPFKLQKHMSTKIKNIINIANTTKIDTNENKITLDLLTATNIYSQRKKVAKKEKMKDYYYDY